MSKQFIDGKFVESHSNETIEVLNPANNKLIGEVSKGNEQDVKDAVAGAVQAQKSWAAINRVKRADIVLQLAAQLEQNKEEIARIYQQEQGKVRVVLVRNNSIFCKIKKA